VWQERSRHTILVERSLSWERQLVVWNLSKLPCRKEAGKTEAIEVEEDSFLQNSGTLAKDRKHDKTGLSR